LNEFLEVETIEVGGREGVEFDDQIFWVQVVEF
jgi:hypothetical protein